jgi:hypothetical protein
LTNAAHAATDLADPDYEDVRKQRESSGDDETLAES